MGYHISTLSHKKTCKITKVPEYKHQSDACLFCQMLNKKKVEHLFLRRRQDVWLALSLSQKQAIGTRASPGAATAVFLQDRLSERPRKLLALSSALAFVDGLPAGSVESMESMTKEEEEYVGIICKFCNSGVTPTTAISSSRETSPNTAS